MFSSVGKGKQKNERLAEIELIQKRIVEQSLIKNVVDDAINLDSDKKCNNKQKKIDKEDKSGESYDTKKDAIDGVRKITNNYNILFILC